MCNTLAIALTRLLNSFQPLIHFDFFFYQYDHCAVCCVPLRKEGHVFAVTHRAKPYQLVLLIKKGLDDVIGTQQSAWEATLQYQN